MKPHIKKSLHFNEEQRLIEQEIIDHLLTMAYQVKKKQLPTKNVQFMKYIFTIIVIILIYTL